MKRPTYQPKSSVRRNQNRSWSLWWHTPYRLRDGSVGFRGHGKVIAAKTCTEKEARAKAGKFMAGVKVPVMHHAGIEVTRAQVDAIMRKQKQDAAQLAARPKTKEAKPEPPKLESLSFTPPAVYLLDSSTCSKRVLGEYLMGRMAEAANLRKGIAQMQTKLTQCETESLFASWLLGNRQAILDHFRRQAGAGGKVLTVPKRSQELIAEQAQRLLGTVTR